MTAINWSNVTTASDFLATANTNSGGYFWTTMLFMAIIVMTLGMIQFSFEIALLTALFIGTILGIMLVYMGLMSMTWLGMIIGAELFLLIYVIVTSNRNSN